MTTSISSSAHWALLNYRYNKSTKVLMPWWSLVLAQTAWPQHSTAYMTAATHIHARTAQL